MAELFIPLLFRERVVDVGRAGKQAKSDIPQGAENTGREKAGITLSFLCPPFSLPSRESNQNANHFAAGEEGKED